MAMGFCILLCFLECSGVSQDDFSMILESSRQADAQNLGPTLPKDFADLLKPAWTMESMMGFLVVSSYPNDWQPDQLEGVPLYEQRKFFKLWGSKFKVVDQDGPRMNHVFFGQNHKGIIFFWILCRVPSSGVKIQNGWCRMTNSGWLLEHSWTSFSEKWRELTMLGWYILPR